MVSVGEPVGMGFVVNLARPGGNITGISNISHDLNGKIVELFVETVPGMHHVGVVQNANNPGMPMQLRATEDAIRAGSAVRYCRSQRSRGIRARICKSEQKRCQWSRAAP
jgi:ABC-type uncharacterized transport system substrate-binding protein